MLISHHRCVCEVEVALIPGCNTFSAEGVAARRHLSSLEPAEPLPRFNYSWRTVSRPPGPGEPQAALPHQRLSSLRCPWRFSQTLTPAAWL